MKERTKYRYRFKTEQEMIDEFGEDWEDTAFPLIGWNTNMNFLFGNSEILKDIDLSEKSPKYIFQIKTYNGNWTIIMTMLKNTKLNLIMHQEK
jgi:hypothetical protein